MKINHRSFSGENDLRAMESLARESRENNLHVTDLPYHLHTWALDDPENVCIWSDDTGRLLAYGILQIPFESLDLVCNPETESDLLPKILTWADERSRAHPEIIPLGTPENEPCWFVNVFSDQPSRIRTLEAFGFACQGDEGKNSWSKVFMQRAADLPVKEFRIPEGFVVRSLAGESELEAYVKLHQETFGTKNMTIEWRRRTLRHPDYIPDLDVVVAAPDGRLAAFCVCWLESYDSKKIGQIEPLGCHSDFRKYALGRVALAEGLRRLQAQGATEIFVETDSWRNTAFQLYESLGFRVKRDVLVYRKDYKQV